MGTLAQRRARLDAARISRPRGRARATSRVTGETHDLPRARPRVRSRIAWRWRPATSSAHVAKACVRAKTRSRRGGVRLERDARGRHDPLRRQPDPAGPRGRACRTRSPRRTRASAPTAGPSGSAGRAVEAVDGARQAPVPALRGRPRHPLAPADDRARGAPTARASAGGARRGAHGSCCGRGGHEVVQFDGPVLELLTASRRALRPADRGAGPRHPRRPSSTSDALPAPAARGRPDAPDRRRAARPAHDRRHRQPLEGRGLLRGRDRPVAADRRRSSDDEALRDRARGAPAHAGVRARRATRTRSAAIYGRAGRPCPRCGGRSAARAVGRQPPDILVPGVPDAERQAHRPQGRRPHRARQHAGELRRRARRRRRHGRVRRAARARATAAAAWCSPTTSSDAARRTPLTLEEGLEHFRQDAWAASSSTSTSSARLRAAGGRRAARRRPGRARADLDDGGREPADRPRGSRRRCGSAGRCRR